MASELEDMIQQNKGDQNRKDKKERKDIGQERTGRKETRWDRKSRENTCWGEGGGGTKTGHANMP